MYKYIYIYTYIYTLRNIKKYCFLQFLYYKCTFGPRGILMILSNLLFLDSFLRKFDALFRRGISGIQFRKLKVTFVYSGLRSQ